MKTNSSLLLCSVLSLVLINGCAKPASKNSNNTPVKCIPESQLNGIVGGYKVSAQDPLAKKVVLLWLTDGKNERICTGTPISHDVILTAAHCIKGITSDNISAIFHTDITCESGFDFPTMSIKARDSIYHTEFYESSTAVGNDVALVKLSASIPANYEVSELYDGQSRLSSDIVTLAGYGSINEHEEGATYLRTTQKSFQEDIEVSGQKMKLQQQFRGICTGDSGGPVFVEVNNRLVIAGVNSYVGQDRKRTICRSYSVSMYTPYFSDWIHTQLGNLR